jgi:flagellar hook-associated protein 2
VIEGADTGDAEQLTLDTTGMSAGGGDEIPVFNETQNAQDAILILDPGANQIQVQNSSNTFTDVIQGITMEAVSDESSSTISIQVEEDEEAMVAAIQDLVAAYNEVTSLIQEQAEVDTETNRGGPLMGDSTLASLQRQLASVIVSVIGEGEIVSAAAIGISTTTDGSLSVNEEKLREKLSESFDDVASFFAGPGSLADQLRVVADTYVDTVDGLLVTRIEGTNASISDLDEQIERAEDRLTTFEENLVRQFAALESAISGLQQQSTFLSQYLTTLTG